MKTLLCTALMSVLAFTTSAQERTLTVQGIQKAEGNICVMVEISGQPNLYFMEKAQEGSITFTFPEMKGEACVISVLHDENANRQMDYDEQMMPKEGYAREKFSLKEGDVRSFSVVMTYPENK